MKLKGGYRYFARLNHDELEIIKNGLELLLDSYEPEEAIGTEYYTKSQDKADVVKLIAEIEEG